MPHKLHLFPDTTSETKNGYSLTHRGVRKDISKKQRRKKLELEITILCFFFEFLKNLRTPHATIDIFERKALFLKTAEKTLELEITFPCFFFEFFKNWEH